MKRNECPAICVNLSHALLSDVGFYTLTIRLIVFFHTTLFWSSNILGHVTFTFYIFNLLFIYRLIINSLCCSVADKAPSEASFRGTEYLTINLSKGDPILSTLESISLQFKTRQPNGLLFYSGKFSEQISLHNISYLLLFKHRAHQMKRGKHLHTQRTFPMVSSKLVSWSWSRLSEFVVRASLNRKFIGIIRSWLL